MDWPQAAPAPRYIPSFSRFTCAAELQMQQAANPASFVYPTANKAFYIPLRLPFRFCVRRVFVANGATASGNFDVGLYSPGGARIFSIGSTAQSGTNVLQYVTLASEKLLVPGSYYLAIAHSNTTGTYLRVNYAAASNRGRICGMLEQTSALPLPSPATFAQLTAMYLPLFGLTSTA